MRRELLDALDRISHGDFNVNLTAGGRGPMPDVIESVNQMAKQLGDLEQQRQDFISSVSHEIQSPLTSISGFAALLQDNDLPPDKRQHYLDVIQAEAERVSSLGDNLLRLSALEEGATLVKRRYRLDEQLRGVILGLEPQWSAKKQQVELDAANVIIDADEDMLRQAWTNLVHNAIKYTPPGGTIRVHLSAAVDGKGSTCQVSDTGIGIDGVDLPHIFERFYRADKSRAGGGNGLGLPLARKIIELHGGVVSVTSQLGVGSVLTVRLPA